MTRATMSRFATLRPKELDYPMLPLLFSALLLGLITTNETTTICDTYLDGLGQTYEICREEGGVLGEEPRPEPKPEPLPIP
jgi:hypothetical protein